MSSSLIICIVAVVAYLIYQVGLLDRPEFVYHNAFLAGQELHAIVATTTEKNIGMHVERLYVGSKKAVESLDNASSMTRAAAKLYGLDENIDAIGVGLYFDDPNAVEHPRWAIGWAVEGASMEDLQARVADMQEVSGIADPLRVVRIGGTGTETILGRIPWRNCLTPMFAAILYWGEAFKTYEKYIAIHKDSDKGVPPIALEVYVTDKNGSYQFLDYLVLFGDASHTWDDTFPGYMRQKIADKMSTQGQDQDIAKD